MDGDWAPLNQIVSLKEKYGAWLMVDEAHATGLYGPNHRGIADALRIDGQIEVQMGTLGKAIGAAGGYICGSRSLIDLLINRGRPFIFTTAPVPAAAGAAIAGIELVRSAEGDARRASLWSQVAELSACIKTHARFQNSAIFPLMVGDETEAVRIAGALRKRGIFIPAIRYPTVARGEARLRLTVSASHTRADVKKLVTALSRLSLKAKNGTLFYPRPGGDDFRTWSAECARPGAQQAWYY
jgi:7-keto-8-aminopelargonate synthetase-like enzyme